MILRFANCELDIGRVVLRRDGTELRIEPQAFDVLAYLIERRGQVVRKGELLDRVWGDRFVSESALTTQIKSVRQAVGDDGSLQRIIRTVHGKGYEFIADVTVVDDVAAHRSETAPEARSYLPAAVQTLIGRDEVLERLEHDLASSRLVTLVGTGGVGKTSVGVELARRVAGRYHDGACIVELVTVVDQGATFEAFASALDVNTLQRASLEDAIVDMLRPRNMLLLLDNCEHLIEPVAELVNRILRAAPGVSILATSREPLAVAAEHVWTIDPLPVDAGMNVMQFDLASVPAIALFVERARAADPAFQLDATTAPAVMEICRRLDGIPLAIELAASRTRALDVTEIALRLDERFRLLRGVRRVADPRHRTLHDAISWSYDLLTAEEQDLFTSLAVFAGPFDLDAAEAVWSGGDVLELLTRLTERSMLAVRRTPGVTRYELLETLREYGRRLLDDPRSVALARAHADHFVAFAQGVGRDLQTADEGAAIARAEGGLADLRAAQRFLVQTGDLDRAFRLVGAIREFAMRALRYEVFGWAASASANMAAARHPLHPLVTGIHAYGEWVRGEYSTAVALAYEARRQETAAGLSPCGLAERVLANVFLTTGDLELGLVEAQRQIAAAEDSGNASRLAHACYMASVAASSSGDRAEGRRLAARAHQCGEQTASPTDLAGAFVADAFAADPDDQAALEAFATADRLAHGAGNRWMSAFARTEAIGILVRQGHLAEASEGLAELVDLWYRAGEWSQQWHTLTRCLIAVDRLGHPGVAAEVVGAIEAHATMGSPPTMMSLRDLAFETRDGLAAKLGREETEERCRVGATRPLVVTVDRVRSALLGRSLDE